ncbi:MAG: carboxylesterase family protein, partial [Alphaproteobacteria bacterium]|nr:carboxylesterase family protein [Alphaproteobacteria bacterium]
MFLSSLLAAAVLMMSPNPDQDAAVRVETAQGGIVGRRADGVASFKGLPYAAPPVGPLRWRPPQRPAAWTGERDAGQVGAICIQPPSNGDPGVGPLPMSEDCLTLNVWTPEARGTEPLPVMVWIHGGGYNNGSGTAALYDGARLAKRGVVVVTINYRLGRLGFFDHPALASERAVGEPAANYGVMDQIAALEWVRDNAAAFGGDPGNVTIFGESAGGAAVTQLMVAPSARGLFHRAVVQSGMGRQRSAAMALDRPGRPSAQSRGRAWARGAGLAAN